MELRLLGYYQIGWPLEFIHSMCFNRLIQQTADSYLIESHKPPGSLNFGS